MENITINANRRAFNDLCGTKVNFMWNESEFIPEASGQLARYTSDIFLPDQEV